MVEWGLPGWMPGRPKEVGPAEEEADAKRHWAVDLVVMGVDLLPHTKNLVVQVAQLLLLV